MKGLSLFVLAVVGLSSASACKYFCRAPRSTQYECCDNGNPYFNEEEAEDKPVEVPVAPTGEVEVSESGYVTQPPSNCYYYCAYDGDVYCCGDTSQPIPHSHAEHDGSCPEEEEQVCKSTGVFLNSKKYQGKTSGAIRLVSGPGKERPACASDGYCSQEEKCCPSKCGRKHICMKSLEKKDEEEEEEE